MLTCREQRILSVLSVPPVGVCVYGCGKRVIHSKANTMPWASWSLSDGAAVSQAGLLKASNVDVQFASSLLITAVVQPSTCTTDLLEIVIQSGARGLYIPASKVKDCVSLFLVFLPGTE